MHVIYVPGFPAEGKTQDQGEKLNVLREEFGVENVHLVPWYDWSQHQGSLPFQTCVRSVDKGIAQAQTRINGNDHCVVASSMGAWMTTAAMDHQPELLSGACKGILFTAPVWNMDQAALTGLGVPAWLAEGVRATLRYVPDVVLKACQFTVPLKINGHNVTVRPADFKAAACAAFHPVRWVAKHTHSDWENSHDIPVTVVYGEQDSLLPKDMREQWEKARTSAAGPITLKAIESEHAMDPELFRAGVKDTPQNLKRSF